MEISAQIIADFRTYYPEFKDTTKWPDDEVKLALEEGDSETGKRWLGYYDRPASIKTRHVRVCSSPPDHEAEGTG